MSNPQRRSRAIAIAFSLGLASTAGYSTIPTSASAQVPNIDPLQDPSDPPPPSPSGLPLDRSPSNEDRIGTDLVPIFPDEPPGTGLETLPSFRPQGFPAADPAKVREVEDGFLESIQSISVPADRALAYEQVIRAFLTTDDWDRAEKALVEGGRSVGSIASPELRDLRAIGLVETAVALNEELIQESTIGAPGTYLTDILGPMDDESRPSTGELLDRARRVSDIAGSIAGLIRNQDFRSSSLARLAESIAEGAGKVYLANSAANAGAGGEADPDSIQGRSARLLANAERIADLIPLRVWRYQTLLRVTNSASNSGMYVLAGPMARRIESPEARVDALIRLAESQSRGDEPLAATRAYREALEAVLAIRTAGVRDTLCEVLVFSLIAANRFEDARITARVGLSGQTAVTALGEISRSMGERGLVEPARRWIDGEPDPGLRSRLLRDLNDGLALWVQRNRPNPTGIYQGGLDGGAAGNGRIPPPVFR